MIRLTALLLLAPACILPAQAGAFDLAFPADCSLGDTCFIQQYFDHDAGPAAADFTCGPLVYDGHDGTDIALPSVAAMAAGTAVLAAAPGTVKGTRDGMQDIAASDPAAPSVENRECGNGVVIEHGNGWETQYCHLRQGSIIVAKGQQIEAGTPLGLIGMSGQADFPHVHLSVRQNGSEVDPFAPSLQTCGAAPTDTLWQTPPPYTPGGIIDAGFSAEVPEFDAIKAGLPAPVLTTKSPALVFWAHVFGARAGDTLLIEVTGPEGQLLAERILLEKTQARLFRAVGKRLKTAGWPIGTYQGTAILLRGDSEIDRFRTSLTLAN